ncbi:MAG: PAS domain-containing sensor histidine kinase, partial [Planctomycetales bacterium]
STRAVEGVPEEEILGASVFDYVTEHQRQTLRNYLDQVFQTSLPVQYEISGVGPQGSTSWYRSRVGPVVREGVVESVVVIATDVTDHRKAAEELKAEQQLLKELLGQQETDLSVISYDIHDGMVQYVAGALMQLEAFEHSEELSNRQRERNLTPALKLLREAMREGRRLISGLRPPILDEMGVASAIEYLIHESMDDEQEIRFQHDLTQERFSSVIESALFRICREALGNARKHSGSEWVFVKLSQQGQRLWLEIRDQGVGFDMDAVKTGAGLQALRERARLMGGGCWINAAPGQGTIVTADLPAELPSKLSSEFSL